LAKTPRLDTYFCGSTSASASTSSQLDEPSTADIGCSDFGENVDVGRLGPPKPESEDTEGEMKFPLRRVGRDCVRIEDAEQTVQEYPTDLVSGKFPPRTICVNFGQKGEANRARTKSLNIPNRA